MTGRTWFLTALGVATMAGPAVAQTPPADGDVAVPPEATTDEGTADEAEEEEVDLEAKTSELDAKVADLESKLAAAEQAQALKPRFPVRLSGYGDIGMFTTQGDGTGFRRDIGHDMFPDRSGYGWVFYGDLLGTQVNSRGDAADLGDAPGAERFDSVASDGNLTFLVNELNMTVNAGLGDSALFRGSVNFTPRTGTDFSLGDAFDVDLAELEWMPTSDGRTSVFVGKVDSVLGLEYKTRKSPERFGITPSLIARYTNGTAVGVKARTKLFEERVILAAAVTNGSFGTEQFHFFSEVDTNNFKTLSGRAAFRMPLPGGGKVEIGGSGQYGTQDGTPDGDAMWFAGVDAEVEISRLDVKATWLKGKAPGDETTMTYKLDLRAGGFVEANVLITPIIGLLGRADFRNAEVSEGMERLYITKNVRGTGGVRLIFNPNAILKAEYSHTQAYGGLPNLPDDVITTSAVMAF